MQWVIPRIRRHLRWARICVKNSDTSFPASIELIVENLNFKVPLWVESISWVEEVGWKSDREGDRRRGEDHRKVSQNSKSLINERQIAPSSSKATEIMRSEAREIRVPRIFNNLNSSLGMGHASIKGKNQVLFNKCGPSNISNANKAGYNNGLKGSYISKQNSDPKEGFNQKKMGQKVCYRVKVVDPCI